ncbi:LOW QUALITY PROTEIN: hypothetical protein YC2023_049238 [Brassica napus]
MKWGWRYHKEDCSNLELEVLELEVELQKLLELEENGGTKYRFHTHYHGCGSPVGLSAGVGAVALLGSIHRGRSVQGLNRYRRRLAPGLGGGSRAEGPNPPPG